MRSRFALWRCRVLGWHPVQGRTLVSDTGISSRFRCGRCGFVGLVDSHGGLF